mmetsp:Transcript_60194/g.141736  ORF Transcript_60194/g.141736 Transcript_60194/m.141736 type:complete len:206 (-) Transcript_60194:70-687(-)
MALGGAAPLWARLGAQPLAEEDLRCGPKRALAAPAVAKVPACALCSSSRPLILARPPVFFCGLSQVALPALRLLCARTALPRHANLVSHSPRRPLFLSRSRRLRFRSSPLFASPLESAFLVAVFVHLKARSSKPLAHDRPLFCSPSQPGSQVKSQTPRNHPTHLQAFLYLRLRGLSPLAAEGVEIPSKTLSRRRLCQRRALLREL